jgi:hypothetical protein
MIPFSQNNDNYFIPETWEEVKYSQYIKVVETQQNEALGATERAARIVAILTQIPLETVNEAGFDLVIKLMERLQFAQTAPEVAPITHVTINGTTYHAQELVKFGELVAFDKVETAFQDAPMQKIPYILAILLRKALELPQTAPKQSFWKKWLGMQASQEPQELLFEAYPNDGNWLERRAKLFENTLSAVQVMSLAAFFLSKEQLSQQTSRLYSANQAILQRLKRDLESISALSTAGKPLFRIWKKILLSIGNYLIQTLT